MVDDILDWPLREDIDSGSQWADWDQAVTRCQHVNVTAHRDRRCKEGVRIDRKTCDALIGSWDTPRQLIAMVEAHARADHGWEPKP